MNFQEQYVITSECLQRDWLKTGRKVGGEKHEGNEGNEGKRGEKGGEEREQGGENKVKTDALMVVLLSSVFESTASAVEENK